MANNVMTAPQLKSQMTGAEVLRSLQDRIARAGLAKVAAADRLAKADDAAQAAGMSEADAKALLAEVTAIEQKAAAHRARMLEAQAREDAAEKARPKVTPPARRPQVTAPMAPQVFDIGGRLITAGCKVMVVKTAKGKAGGLQVMVEAGKGHVVTDLGVNKYGPWVALASGRHSGLILTHDTQCLCVVS